MKKKIEQLLNGKFEYEQPQLLFSKEKISLTMKAGETKRGEVYVGTEDNQKIRGYVTSSAAGWYREWTIFQELLCVSRLELIR